MHTVREAAYKGSGAGCVMPPLLVKRAVDEGVERIIACGDAAVVLSADNK